jgi:hypothetical protein
MSHVTAHKNSINPISFVVPNDTVMSRDTKITLHLSDRVAKWTLKNCPQALTWLGLQLVSGVVALHLVVDPLLVVVALAEHLGPML